MNRLCMSIFSIFSILYLSTKQSRNKCLKTFHFINSVALTAGPKIEFDMKKIKRTSAKYDFIAFEIFGT